MNGAGESLYRGDVFLIVRAPGPRGSPAERPVLVFQCYLDDSGTSGLPIVSMAGFVSPMKHWEELEPRLDAVMNGHGVPVFHAKEFHDTKPPFKDWKKVRKRSFAEEVFSTTHGLIYGLSITISRKDFEEAKKIQGGWDTMSAIGVCFSAIMTRIVTDPSIGPAVKQEGVSFLVETGNRNNSEIEQFFHKMAKHPTFEGCLRSISFVPKASWPGDTTSRLLCLLQPSSYAESSKVQGQASSARVSVRGHHGEAWPNLGARGVRSAYKY